MNVQKTIKAIVVVGTISLVAAGCGTSSATPIPPAPHSAAAATSHRKPGKVQHIRGVVSALTTNQLTLKTPAGKVLSFALSTKTKYRQKKSLIARTQIPTGATVIVGAVPQHAARLVRLVSKP